MKIGQTSLVVFLSKVVGSALGFIATVYFARILGAEVLGVYFVIVATVAWIQVGGQAGISKATNKRISEGDEPGAFLTAGFVLLVAFIALVSATVFLFRPYLEIYISGFEQYSSISVIWFLIMIGGLQLVFLFVIHVLKGQRMVHIAGILKPTKIGIRSLLQIGLVILGFGLVGMLIGYMIGVILVTLLGIVFITIRPVVPERPHFRSLFDYAKFSWMGGLQSRALNDVDILVLNVLVSTNLVGIYAVSWTLTKFLDLFSGAVGDTLFPELSNIRKQKSIAETTGLIEDAIAYAGFITIPGLIGGVILSDRLLRIYGPEFVQGTEVLWLLLASILLFGYFRQCINALNALDYPDVAFRVNVVFITSNIVMNVVLIWQFGWIGAAIASVLSVSLGTVLSYYLLSLLVPLTIPFDNIGQQVTAAAVMGIVVLLGRIGIEETAFQHNFVIITVLVTLGITVYVAVLLAISPQFRSTVRRNLPFEFPHY